MSKNKHMLLGIGLTVGLIAVGYITLLEPMISYFKINQSAVNIDIQTSITKSTLPIPPLLEDKNPDPNIADFTLEPQEGETSFLPNTKTRTMGYNGSFLGPVIRVSKGEQVNVHVNNKLKEATTVHWHGLEVEGEKDGGPHQGIEPGTTWEPSFTVNQQAATLWYHPHFGGNTATQVYKGLAGLFYVDDEVSKSLNIPKEYGVN
ncbi:TPA: multicopper oxidase domain-containing protein, partial [Streptococcus suis]